VLDLDVRHDTIPVRAVAGPPWADVPMPAEVTLSMTPPGLVFGDDSGGWVSGPMAGGPGCGWPGPGVAGPPPDPGASFGSGLLDGDDVAALAGWTPGALRELHDAPTVLDEGDWLAARLAEGERWLARNLGGLS
jgi:hypothetical protein